MHNPQNRKKSADRRHPAVAAVQIQQSKSPPRKKLRFCLAAGVLKSRKDEEDRAEIIRVNCAEDIRVNCAEDIRVNCAEIIRVKLRFLHPSSSSACPTSCQSTCTLL